MKKKIHVIASILGFLTIVTFFISTISIELVGNHEVIAKLKSLIVFPGLVILLPAMIVAGATGFQLSNHRTETIIEQKKRRMPIMAGIGLLILTPAAITLHIWASLGEFGVKFYLVQFIELIGGASNIVLMMISIRDGIKLSGRWNRTLEK